jgi:hypothetical protein
MLSIVSYLTDFGFGFSAFSARTCLLACANTFGWKTCLANSSVVMSFGCFFFLVMVSL